MNYSYHCSLTYHHLCLGSVEFNIKPVFLAPHLDALLGITGSPVLLSFGKIGNLVKESLKKLIKCKGRVGL